MKRFLLFSGDDYYPLGGAMDFKNDFDSIQDAIEEHDVNEYDYSGGWANIFDTKTRRTLMSFKRGTWQAKESHYDVG